MSTRDGITGMWDGTGQNTSADLSKDYLSKLSLTGQARLLQSELSSRLAVTGAEGTATLTASGASLTTIARPDPEYFLKDLVWVRTYADLRIDRTNEILAQLNDLLSFFGALGYLDASRRKYTTMLLDVVRRIAIHVETPAKYYCRASRPIDYALEVQPMIQTPDHSSYPSGHATEAFAIATILSFISGQTNLQTSLNDQALPFRLAQRISANRTIAGVHFPVDSHAGAWLGCHVGLAVYALAIGSEISVGDMPVPTVASSTQTPDFLLSTMQPLATDKVVRLQKSPLVEEFWTKARSEWA